MFNGFLRQGSSANQTVSTAIGGGYSLTKTGTGVLTLSGSNTFTGGMTINAGTVSVTAIGNMGANGTTINAGGTLRFAHTSGTLNCTKVLSGTGTITKTANGVLTLQVTNPFSGTIDISAGDFVFDHLSAAQGNPAVTMSGTSRLLLSSPFVGATCTISSLTGVSGNTIYTAYNATVGTRTLEVAQAGNTTYAGIMTDASTRLFALTKSGAGNLTLSGLNTFTGGLIVNGGTLTSSAATAVGNGAVTINSGGTLTYTVDSTGTRTVTVNAGGTVNKGGFAHTGTTFVNNGGTINA